MAILPLVLYLALAITTHDPFWLLNADIHLRTARIAPGMTASEITHIMGTPSSVFDESQNGTDYYIEGYTHKERPITRQVWIYYGSFDAIVYIYFDNDMQVEEMFIGGS